MLSNPIIHRTWLRLNPNSRVVRGYAIANQAGMTPPKTNQPKICVGTRPHSAGSVTTSPPSPS